MKINREELKKMATLNDAQLWAQIRAIAAQHGYSLPEKSPSSEDLKRVRNALDGTERINLADAMKFVNNYKQKGGK